MVMSNDSVLPDTTVDESDFTVAMISPYPQV